jgi:hypothetical protein
VVDVARHRPSRPRHFERWVQRAQVRGQHAVGVV